MQRSKRKTIVIAAIILAAIAYLFTRRKANMTALEFIAFEEKCSSKRPDRNEWYTKPPSDDALVYAYWDGSAKWTIGYGNTYVNGRPVKRGDVITYRQAKAMLAAEVSRLENGIRKAAKRPLTNGTAIAFISLAYNYGLQRTIDSGAFKLWNSGASREQIAEAFRRIVLSGDGSKNGIDDDRDGVIDEAGEKARNRGLVNRREKEIKFLD